MSKLNQQIDQILDLATEEKLSIVLNKALAIALVSENIEFSYWLECEISGYLENNKTYIDFPVTVPNYRKVVGYYMDDNKITLQQYYSDLAEFNFIFLRQGVSELENLAEFEESVSMREPKVMAEFSTKFNIPITQFVFHPTAIISVLQDIRNKLIKELIKIKKSNNSDSSFLNQNEASKYIKSLHKNVQKTAGNYFEDGHYRSAIVDTYINLVEEVKKKSGVYNRDNSPLMDFVFSVNKPILKISEDNDKQQGLMLLFKGAVMFVRNYNVHNVTDWNDQQRTLEWLGYASALYNLLDECENLSLDHECL